jgi:hypothetical protein
VKSVTNRSINSTVICRSWPVIEGGNGTTDNIVIKTDFGHRAISIPMQNRADRTIFMLENEHDCGEGCSVIQAIELSDTSAWFYNCSANVGSVVNATTPIQEVGSSLTKLASSSIALRGYASRSESTDNDEETQYSIYPAETVVGYPNNGSTIDMALVIARFSIGVIAAAAQMNAMEPVAGKEPAIGSKLQIEHWESVNIIFVSTIIVQLLLGLANLYFAHKIIIPNNGLPDEARILRPMMKDNPSRPVFKQKRSKNKDTSQWIYRNRSLGDGLFDLYLEEM